MRLTLHIFERDAPLEGVCEQGKDYQASEHEVSAEQVVAFVEHLSHPRDSFYVYGPGHCDVEVWKHDRDIWVEILGAEFWAISEVSRDALRAVLEMVSRGEQFGGHVPTTEREWDAYGFMGEGG